MGRTPMDRQPVLDAFRRGARGTAEAAKFSGVNINTVKRWMKDPKFRAEVDEIRGTAFPDFLAFRERFFGYYLPTGEIIKAQNYFFHTDGYEKIKRSKRLLMLVPPMHLKTSVWSIEYATYLIMRDRRVRVTVIQKSADEAKKIVRAVQERLTSHAYYQGLGIPRDKDPITLFGGKDGFKPKSYRDGKGWGAEQFTVLGSELLGEKDPTMQAKGAGSAILSVRSEFIILDDIQDPAKNSPTDVTKLIDWLQLQVLTRLGPESQLVVLGSRVGPNDFYSHLLEEDFTESWEVVKYPAVLNWREKKQLLPDVWSWDKLMAKRKEVGNAWYSAYMMEEGERDDAVFTKAKMDAAKSSEHLLGEVPEAVTHVYVGMDPAIVKWNAICVWGLDHRTGRRYLVDLVRRKGMQTWENVVNLLEEVSIRYKPYVVTVETNNTQWDPYYRAQRQLGRHGFVVRNYQTVTGSGARGQSEDFSISSIAALYDQGLVVLPWGDDNSRQVVGDYISEFCQWHTAEDGTSVKHLIRDQVMATLFAESQARSQMMLSTKPMPPSRAPRFATNGKGGWRHSKVLDHAGTNRT